MTDLVHDQMELKIFKLRLGIIHAAWESSLLAWAVRPALAVRVWPSCKHKYNESAF